MSMAIVRVFGVPAGWQAGGEGASGLAEGEAPDCAAERTRRPATSREGHRIRITASVNDRDPPPALGVYRNPDTL